jgi:hypothetical protein
VSYFAHFFLLEGIGENENVLLGDESIEAGNGLIEEGGFIEEVEKLFRFGVSAQGPKTGSTSSGKNQGIGITHLWMIEGTRGTLVKTDTRSFFILEIERFWGILRQ